MALKAVLESLDDVPEALRAEYKEQDGKFVLDIDGVDQHPTVVNLKTAFERVKADKRKLTDDLKAANTRLEAIPEDFDPEEYLRLKAEAEAAGADPDKKGKGDEHLQSQKQFYEQRIANLEKKHGREIEDLRGKLANQEAYIGKILDDDGLTKALVEVGVSKEYLKAAKALLRDSVKVTQEDGEYRAVVETDLGPDDIGKFVHNWAQSDEGKVFIAKPTGGDAKGGNGRLTGENPWAKDQRNLTKQQEIIAANPEKARQLATAAGVKPNW